MMDEDRAAVAVAGAGLMGWTPAFGAIPGPAGTRFSVWAPSIEDLTLVVRNPHGIERHSPQRGDDGIWTIVIAESSAGTRYAYSIDGGDPRPDPASRFQPDGVHGWSEVIDPSRFSWHDRDWTGVDPARLVIYELHVGTFSGNGTFASVAERLPYLRDLGVTAIELMPVADFPGQRNWGYDGVTLFAPSRAYGRPDDLRALVDRAHGLGLAVILDVVYNHLGPEGAYLPLYSPEFWTSAHTTPWGNAVNLDGAGSEVVRGFLTDNALQWIHEYHIDGLRLDATHALIDTRETFLRELTSAVHRAREHPPMVFAEDHRNLAAMVMDVDRGGWGLDGVWADDFHHVVRRMLGGEAYGYYVDYEGRARELAETLRRGWLYAGQHSVHHKQCRGTDPADVAMRKAVVCVQNHDQIGNRALGDRLHHAVDAAQWRAAVTVLLTAPMTPLLFMGQEWSASTPFQFFTDFEPDLGAKVVEGRRREFRAFPEFASDAAAGRLPNPQSIDTFEASRLKWDEQQQPPHAAVLALHRALLSLRSEYPALQASDACSGEAIALDASTVMVVRREAGQEPSGSNANTIVMCARLNGLGEVAVDLDSRREWHVLFSTEEERFADDPRPIHVDAARGMISFPRPGAVILRAGQAR